MIPILLSILVVSILLLAIPIDLILTLKREGGWHGRIIVYWLSGLIHANIRVGRRRKGRRKSLKPVARQLVKQRNRLSAMLRSEGFIRQLVALVVKLVKELKPRRFKLKCTIGADNPADTGRLLALFAPLKFISGAMKFGRASNTTIQISPDFSGPRFTGHICTSVHFVPLKLVGIFLGFAFSRPVLRAVKAAIFRPGN